MQEEWEASRVYEANAPQDFDPSNYDFT